MSTHHRRPSRRKNRPVVQLNTLDEQPRPKQLVPSAQETILAWLLWLPAEADPKVEARRELERLAAREKLPTQALELQELLRDIASA